MSETFVHLHLHSEFSLSDGIVRLKPLVDKCIEFAQPAVAVTDLSNLYGVVKFYKACLANGVKPIIGCDVWVENPVVDDQFDRLTLLCKDNLGYRNLCNLLTIAYLRGTINNRPVIPHHKLSEHHHGLICFIDDQEGPLAQSNFAGADFTWQGSVCESMEKYQALFLDNLYLSVSRVGRVGEQQYINFAAEVSAKLNIGLVATNRVVYLAAQDYDAHEIRVCINEGRVLEDSRRPRNFTNQQYFKSSDEMLQLFHDLPAAIANTVEIARRCNVFMQFEEAYLPDFPDTQGLSEAELLCQNAEQGLAGRLNVPQLYAADGAPQVASKYIDRLKMELQVIQQMGYPGYFLIVADFIQWSRDNDIPVGPGRGSGAGSLVAWACGITELDPLDYDLIFERFLNPERVSLPDFDIDFCVDGRDRVIEYVAKRYGADQVAQIITFGTMAAKAVIRDVGRVMGFPFGFVDTIAKLIPFDVGITLQKALDSEELLRGRYEEEADVQQLIGLGLQLEGIAKNVSKHAGGVVIAPKPLSEYTPLYAENKLSQPVTQLDKKDLEAIGLVKFDFLGLRTLTIIDAAVKMVNADKIDSGGEPLTLARIPLDDKKTYEFVQKGTTTAVFQLESRGMKELIMKAYPQTFEDIIALIALFRPGPLQSGMVDDFVNRKAGREPIKYLHPELESILSTTYGVILYQEQVMKIAQVLAGYTLGGADLLRNAMGKKLLAEMEKQRVLFMSGSAARGIDQRIAKNIFDLMEKFAGYGFNKSHSAAYALISYHTAWLKTHYPAAFMSATLSADMDNTDKVVTLLSDCKVLGLEVLPPQINSSSYIFNAVNETQISYGLGAVKGVGQGVVETIVSERVAHGNYENLYDFCRRLDMRKVNKRVLEAMVKSGALDQLGENRATLMSVIPDATKAADQQRQNELAGQFDMLGVAQTPVEIKAIKVVEDWSEEVRLQGEKETLGLYLTGHPYTRYAEELNSLSHHNVATADLSIPRNGIFSGILVAMRVLNTQRGKKMAFITLDNSVQRVEVSFFAEKFSENIGKLQKDRCLTVVGEMSADEFSGGCQIRAEHIFTMDELRRDCLLSVEIRLQQKALDAKIIKALQALLLKNSGGKVNVRIHYRRSDGEMGLLDLGEKWAVKMSPALLDSLLSTYGADNIKYFYNTKKLTQYYPAKPSYRRRAAVHG